VVEFTQIPKGPLWS